MTHDLSAHPARPSSRWTRRIATLAIALVTAALAVPAVTAAQPIPADPTSSYPSTGGKDQAFAGSVTALVHKDAPPTGIAALDSPPPPETAVVLRRDGNPANINVALAGQEHNTAAADHAIVLRRDGSKADPFVANVGGTPTTTASDSDFAWGDAAIGAGVALGLIALAGATGLALRRNGTYSARSVPTGS
jgi:hypothetical protein